MTDLQYFNASRQSSPTKRAASHQEHYSPTKRAASHQQHYSPLKQAERYSPGKRAASHQKHYSPEKRAASHQEHYSPEERAKKHEGRKIFNADHLEKDFNRIRKFESEIKYGLSFICTCCERILFKRAVSPITEAFIQELEVKNLLHCTNQKDAFKFEDKFYMCQTCYSSLKGGKMPSQCFQNNLQVSEIPEALQDLTDLEIQLLSKNILFLKVRQLPKTRMNTLNDRVICVPIEDDDVVKTVESLPRNSSNNGLVWVRFKRQLLKKAHYMSEMVRPQKIYEALHYLKSHHPSYKNIKIENFDIMEEMFETSKTDEDTNEDSDEEIHSNSEEENDTPGVGQNNF